MNPNFPTRLKWHRTKNGYSLAELGALTGISKQDLNRMEEGFRNPTKTQLRDLSRALKFTFD